MGGDIIRHQLSIKSENEVANYLDLSPKDISEIFSSSDFKTRTQEKISSIFNLPISFFYDEAIAKKVIFSLNDINENLLLGNRGALTTNPKKDKELNFLSIKVEAYKKTLEALGTIDGSRFISTPPPPTEV